MNDTNKRDDTQPDLDAITALAAALCQAPICLFFELADTRITILSKVGWDRHYDFPVFETFFEELTTGQPGDEIEDTARHPKLAMHPFVTGPEQIRFCAAVSLQTPDGTPAGALCVLDRQTRKLTNLQRQTLEVLARQAMVQLSYRRAVADLQIRNADLDETARIAGVGRWRSDLATGELIWSETAHEIFGTHPSSFGHDLHSFFAAVHPADRMAMTSAEQQTIMGKPLDIQHRICRPDGTVRWVHERGELIKDPSGTPICVAGTVQDITERKVLSRDLELLFEFSNDLISIASTDGHFQRVNPAFERTLGWTPKELLAKPIVDFVVPPDQERARQEFGHPRGDAGTRRFELRFRTREGQVHTLEWAVMPIPEEYAWYGIARDVTEERELESELARAASQVTETLESMTDAYVTLDRDWRVTFLNRGAEMLLRIPRDQLLGQNLWRELPEDIGATFLRRYHLASEERDALLCETYCETWGRWLEIRSQPLEHGFGIFLRDLTETKRATEELRVLETCIERLNDIVLITEAEPIDEPGPRIIFANEAFFQRMGYSREETLGKSPRFLQGPNTSRKELERIRVAFEKNESIRAELINYTKSGEQVCLEIDIVPVMNEQGLVTHRVAVQRDVTARNRADEELRATAERYQALFDSNPLPMWVFDLESLAFLAVNGAAIRRYQYSREEFLAMTILDIRPADDIPALRVSLAERSSGLSYSGVWRHQTKDGSLLSAEVYSHSVVLDGRSAMLVTPLDVTEKIELEKRLRQSQKMETIGRLAGGVAHDFNNLLTVINGYTRILLDRVEEGKAAEDRQRTLGHILRSGERAAELTAQLLAFSRQQVLQPQTVAVNDLLREIEPILNRLIREDIEIAWRLASDVGSVSLDPSQFEQVIMNLAVNASDAMPQGGHLTIETKKTFLDDPYCRLHPDLKPGFYATISMSDDGHGMPPETASRVFEPFFTTKEIGSGTGLGLATAYGIITQSGGQIAVSSEVGLGTRFDVHLPEIKAQANLAQEIEMPDLNVEGTETILLVEDDTDVRVYTAEILRRFGYRVIEAGSGPDAIAESERCTGPIDLLLTDVVMPKLNGRDLAEFISRRRPETKVLFASGYTENVMTKHAALGLELNLIAKPFSPIELGRKVRSVLDSPNRQKTVLILDDEAGIRALFGETLQSAGYQTLQSDNGLDAMRILRQRPVDLLITDLVMPGQEGIETIVLVRREFPSLKILATSGYGAGQFLKAARALGATETIPKPVQVQDLRDRVKAMIG